MKNNDCFRLKNPQSGMALIEVLVAMLVLTIGILALLSVQLRTVASVREAETQTIVSQITQNLMEGMLLSESMVGLINIPSIRFWVIWLTIVWVSASRTEVTVRN